MGSNIIPVVQNLAGKLMVSSLNIASVFGKRHKNVLQAIEKEKKYFTGLNFQLSEYIDGAGRKLSMYLLDDEFTIFVMLSFTGNKAKEFKLSYIKEFNRMRAVLKQQAQIQNDEKDKEISTLQKLLALESQKLTQKILETNHQKEMNYKRSKYYNTWQETDIFGNVVDKREFIAKDKALIYKINCCNNVIIGCTIKKSQYENELNNFNITTT